MVEVREALTKDYGSLVIDALPLPTRNPFFPRTASQVAPNGRQTTPQESDNHLDQLDHRLHRM